METRLSEASRSQNETRNRLAPMQRMNCRPACLATAVRPHRHVLSEQLHQTVEFALPRCRQKAGQNFTMLFRRWLEARAIFGDIFFGATQKLSAGGFFFVENRGNFSIFI